MTEELQKKVDRAIKLIQSASKIAKEHGQPLEVAYSGGKDSDVILELTKMAGVPYRAIYKNTTIDPPGTIKHAKDKGCEVRQPEMTFMQVIEKVGFPSRFMRVCCKFLKEYKIFDYAILGIRKEESRKRAELYKEPEKCRVYSKKEKVRQYYPILEWTAKDIEEFIQERGIKCHKLYYDEDGKFHVERRVGCMCCPMMSKRKRIEEFKRYPNMVKYYIRGGRKYIDNHPNCKTAKLFKISYEWLCMDIFCPEGMDEFNNKFIRKGTLFDDGINCKKYLEDFFNIKF